MRGKEFQSAFAIFLCLLVGLLAVPAGAWEFAYGSSDFLERANRRVAPVAICPGGGYIAVGTRTSASRTNTDVYVVRTDSAGWTIWEHTYDILQMGLPDEGIAIVEVSQPDAGFVVLSNTRNGPWSPALTFLKCNGFPGWSQLYRDVTGGSLRGLDLIRTATGDPGSGTAPGDLAVAGVATGSGGNEDAYLMRTNLVGGLVFGVIHNAAGQEAFHALAEADLLPSQLTADLVAAGRYQKTGASLQGLVARVNGAKGKITAASHCLAQHGGDAADVYHSVTLLATAPFAGEFALVGVTADLPWLEDVWVVRGTPCAITGQSRIGDAGGVAAEAGLDIREVLVPVPGILAAGDLAIAGYQGPAAGGPFEAVALFVSGGTLMPIFGNLFGDHAGSDEVFHSLAEIPAGVPQPPGFVYAGLTRNDWAMVGDPQDLYQVHADPAVPQVCAWQWWPSGVTLNWPYQPLEHRDHEPVKSTSIWLNTFAELNPFQVCP